MENPFKKAIENNQNKENIDEKQIEDNSEQVDTTENTEAENSEASESSAHETQEDIKDEAPDENSKLKEDYEKLHNQYIRLAADFDNYRKRHEQEKEALLKYGAENTLKKMLEVLDNFERGLKAIESVEDCDKVKECYNLAYKNFTDVLTKAGLQTIKAEGEEFNPNLHEAVMQTPTSEKPENTIITELQKGYMLEEKVLRPSLVNVAVAEN